MSIIRVATLVLTLSILLEASTAISGGVWFNYRYVQDNVADTKTVGDMADEALVFYVDHNKEDSPWSLSAEMRMGPGSFTDPENNSTKDYFTLHKLWVNYKASESLNIKVGKSQVPFGWKTSNFWPGDMFQAGYGDQMDVGVKASGDMGALHYNLAYYHADDWGETSTDTVDDNKHWGSSTSYRKIKTVVADLSYDIAQGHNIGIAAQAGVLQDLGNDTTDVSGYHYSGIGYYKGKIDALSIKAEGFYTDRRLPDTYLANGGSGLETNIKSIRGALELGYTLDEWYIYLDSTWAKSLTTANNVGLISAYAPGVRYSYGPGWIYLEYLTQNGWMDRNSETNSGDFNALYLSIDYYF